LNEDEEERLFLSEVVVYPKLIVVVDLLDTLGAYLGSAVHDDCIERRKRSAFFYQNLGRVRVYRIRLELSPLDFGILVVILFAPMAGPLAYIDRARENNSISDGVAQSADSGGVAGLTRAAKADGAELFYPGLIVAVLVVLLSPLTLCQDRVVDKIIEGFVGTVGKSCNVVAWHQERLLSGLTGPVTQYYNDSP
jgi:hypothetical protein